MSLRERNAQLIWRWNSEELGCTLAVSPTGSWACNWAWAQYFLLSSLLLAPVRITSTPSLGWPKLTSHFGLVPVFKSFSPSLTFQTSFSSVFSHPSFSSFLFFFSSRVRERTLWGLERGRRRGMAEEVEVTTGWADNVDDGRGDCERSRQGQQGAASLAVLGLAGRDGGWAASWARVRQRQGDRSDCAGVVLGLGRIDGKSRTGDDDLDGFLVGGRAEASWAAGHGGRDAGGDGEMA